MSDCEFYERIYATSTLTSSTKILRSKATTENFQITFKPALEQVYAAISIFVDRVKQYFEKPGFIEAFKPFSVEFQPLLDDIINNEQTVRKIADQVSMQGIQGRGDPVPFT
jgi:predicted patatin/cPLA2 family phospholipase